MAVTERSKRKGVLLYEALRKDLLRLIETEHLNILPNEKTLMTRFHISRNTLRHAIADLTKENILEPIQGVGTLVHPETIVVAGATVLVICDRIMEPFQQEIFNQLFFRMSQCHLNVSLLTIDKEHVDIPFVEQRIRASDAIILDLKCSFSSVLRDLVSKCGKKRICLRWNATREGVSCVETDIEKGVCLLMKHLVGLGHRRIVCIGVQEKDLQRMPGILKAKEETGVFPVGFVNGSYTETTDYRDFGYQLLDEAFEKYAPFTAVFCNNDEIALGVEENLLRRGLRIPEDISVTGFDNTAMSGKAPVPLTTCSGSTSQMISEALGYLFSAERPENIFYRKIEPELVIRSSTGKVQN